MANSNGWGDGAANNSIGWGQGANNNIGWGDSHAKSWAGATDIVGITTDPASTEFFTATGITGATQKTAIDNLVKGLKADGLWSKMKAVYPFVTDNRNLLSYTEDFSNAAWSKSQTSIVTNAINAPNGTLTADKLIETVNNTIHFCVQTTTQKESRYNYSIYLKYESRQYVAIDVNDGTSGIGIVVDIQNGIYVGTMSIGTGFTLNSYAITSVGNGWYRCSVDITFTSAASASAEVVLRNSNTTSWSNSYTGNGSGVYVWGAQLELGSTLTTYQPQLGSAQSAIASQFKYNLVNPVDSDAAFRLVFNGGWTHSSTGATPNGTNGYADTKLIPSSSLSTTSGHFSFYSRTNNNTGVYDMGSSIGASAEQNLITRYLDDKFYACYGLTAQVQSIANTSSLGLFVTNRNSATNTTGFKNGTKLNNGTQTSALSTRSLYISALNSGVAGSYSNRQTAFATIGDGLTDTEAANLYTRVQTFNQALSRQVGVPIVSDADAQAFLNSAEITDITQANAINTLVTDLKAQGLWTKMKAIYPFVGGTASTHKYNLKDPRDLDAAYRLVFNGGWTHSSTGATPNGTNGYADTKLVPSSVLTLNSTHLSYYSRTNNTFDAAEIGSSIGGSQQLQIITNFTGISYDAINNAPAGTARSWTTDAMFVASRTASNLYKSYRNSSIVATYTTASGSLPTLPIYVGGRAGASLIPTNRQCAFSTIGDGLNDTEATALYNAVNNYQVALSRNI